MLPDPPAGVQQEMIARFVQLAAEVDAINADYSDEQLATVLDWLRRANDAVERNTERLRRRP